MRQVVSKFIGVIEGIEIRNQSMYNTIDYILENIERKFGKCYNTCFVIDLKECIEYLYLKYEQFDFSQLEAEFNINVKRFKDIVFTYMCETYGFDELNKELKTGNKYMLSRKEK